jgi:hypothetical protein
MCIYCGLRPASENEHIVGKVFYVDPPRVGITVPSCPDCNRKRSKFFRDSSSFQVVLPGESGCKCNTAPLSAAWHEMHRAWPGRLARKMGCTLVLKNSKFSDVGAVEDGTGCRLSNPTSKTQQRLPLTRALLISKNQLPRSGALLFVEDGDVVYLLAQCVCAGRCIG